MFCFTGNHRRAAAISRMFGLVICALMLVACGEHEATLEFTFLRDVRDVREPSSGIATRVSPASSFDSDRAKIHEQSPSELLSAVFQTKIAPMDGQAGDNLGTSVSVSGDRAIVGAYADDDKGMESGSAYVFLRNGETWSYEAKLLADDGVDGDNFGASVALFGDRAIVGSPRDDASAADSGSAYIFVRSGGTWLQEAKLVAADGGPSDDFGNAVAIFENTAIAGARGADSPIFQAGAAYVFAFDGMSWSQQAKLVASDGAQDDFFGQSVSLYNGWAMIGSPYDDDLGPFSGSAYVFMRNGTSWSEYAKLLALDGEPGDWFGMSVSFDPGTAFVGAFGDDDRGSNAGSVYVFSELGGNWNQAQKLLAPDGVADDKFGYSVSYSGDKAIIGAPENDANGAESGAAYLFARQGLAWTHQQKVVAPDGAPAHFFGSAVAIAGNTVVVGAPNVTIGANVEQGAAYVYAVRQFNGHSCAVGDDCLSGNCVDGFCCDTPCSSVCRACSAAKKGQGVDGVCGDIVADTDPDDECPNMPVSSCATTGACNGTGACQLFSLGMACAQPTCIGSAAQDVSTCDGMGTCVPGSVQSCAPFICNAGQCITTCTPGQLEACVCLDGQPVVCPAPAVCQVYRCDSVTNACLRSSASDLTPCGAAPNDGICIAGGCFVDDPMSSVAGASSSGGESSGGGIGTGGGGEGGATGSTNVSSGNSTSGGSFGGSGGSDFNSDPDSGQSRRLILRGNGCACDLGRSTNSDYVQWGWVFAILWAARARNARFNRVRSGIRLPDPARWPMPGCVRRWIRTSRSN